MYCQEFIFDGISSREYDLLICSFDGAENGQATAGSKIEFSTFKASKSNRWVKTGVSYNEQLIFTFQICKNPCSQDVNKPFTEREIAFFMRWLVRKEYKHLQLIQEGFENIFYNCQLNVERYLIAGACYGFEVTATCDAPWGWSDINTTTISSSSTKTVNIYDSSDEIGVLFPRVELYVHGSGDIRIKNELTNTETVIKNCIAGENIVMDNMIITSSKYENHKTLYDDFNWNWFEIGNTFTNRSNPVTVTGNCDIALTWRCPRKAVV